MSEHAYDHDQRQMQRLRTDAALHNVDFNRARLSKSDGGGLNITFKEPVVDLGPWREGVPTGTVRAFSAEGAEAAMLDGLIRLHVAERRRIRVGLVCGMSGDQINRTPLTDAEIAAFKARISQADKVARMEQELADALRDQAARTAAAQAAADLANRYNVTTPRAPAKPKPGTTAISGKPTKRANRKEVNSHE